MLKRVPLKLFSIISLVIAPFIGGFGIYQLMQLSDMTDEMKVNTAFAPFGILGAFELFRAGMSSVIYAGFLAFGAVCLWNALCMVILGILSLVAVKKQSVNFITVLLWANRILMVLIFALLIVPNIPTLASSYAGFAGIFIGCGLMTLSQILFNTMLKEERSTIISTGEAD